MPPRFQSLLEGARVLDDAVVNDGDFALAVDVRMRVAFIRNAVRGPASVSDTRITLYRAGGK